MEVWNWNRSVSRACWWRCGTRIKATGILTMEVEMRDLNRSCRHTNDGDRDTGLESERQQGLLMEIQDSNQSCRYTNDRGAESFSLTILISLATQQLQGHSCSSGQGGTLISWWGSDSVLVGRKHAARCHRHALNIYRKSLASVWEYRARVLLLTLRPLASNDTRNKVGKENSTLFPPVRDPVIGCTSIAAS